MARIFTIIAITILSAIGLKNNAMDQKEIILLYTTDVHGHFFPYDFINGRPAAGSLARVATAVDSIRQAHGKQNVILLDNGDILQGQPSVYYYNFIDTLSPHITTEIYQYLGYDATSVGNHDIETGHNVYDRWRADANIPVLAANVIDKSTGQPYFQPYTVIERDGLRIAVIGLLTPAIPAWLPERLWSGLEFLPMESAASHWVNVVRENESPDVVIGLFHSGRDASKTTAGYKENESLTIARNIDGFDAVLMGHDHQLFCEQIENINGKKVAVVNPANNANNLGVIKIMCSQGGSITITPEIIDISNISPSADYLERFKQQFDDVNNFVNQKVTDISSDISTRDSYFGPSAFMTLLHKLQLEISGADISMAAPLTFDGMIKKGPLTIADMFTLYKYENNLCTLNLTGQEIKDYLEYSYSLWTETVDSEDKHLINFASDSPTPTDNRLQNPSYNFDSASGIDYEVDITRPKGDKIKIIRMSNCLPFDLQKTYTVAINSYRAGGGGNHLTEGAGIAPELLKDRIISTTDKDLRYYLMQTLRKRADINPEIERNWKFIPEEKASRHSVTDHASLRNGKLQ